jgi:hypothetical protein
VSQRLGPGPFLALAAVVGAILAALPYFGLGPDTSPSASSYIERRYGNIGIGLVVMWLVLMAATFAVGVVLTIVKLVGRSRRDARQGSTTF